MISLDATKADIVQQIAARDTPEAILGSLAKAVEKGSVDKEEDLVDLLGAFHWPLPSPAQATPRESFAASLLFLCASNGWVQACEALLDAGVPPEESDTTKFAATPLLTAALCGRLGVVELLATRGACVDHRNDIGQTPLCHAASGSHPAIIQALLRHGADPRLACNAGRTPLHYCFEDIDFRNTAVVDCVEALLSAGASMEAIDEEGLDVWAHARLYAGMEDAIRARMADRQAGVLEQASAPARAKSQPSRL